MAVFREDAQGFNVPGQWRFVVRAAVADLKDVVLEVLTGRCKRLSNVRVCRLRHDPQTGLRSALRASQHGFGAQERGYKLVIGRKARRRERIDEGVSLGRGQSQEAIGAVGLERRVRIVQVKAY